MWRHIGLQPWNNGPCSGRREVQRCPTAAPYASFLSRSRRNRKLQCVYHHAPGKADKLFSTPPPPLAQTGCDEHAQGDLPWSTAAIESGGGG